MDELSLFALDLFVGVFALTVLRAFGYKTKRDHEDVAALPLQDGTQRTEVNRD